MDSRPATSPSGSTSGSSSDGDQLEGDLVLQTPSVVKPHHDTFDKAGPDPSRQPGKDFSSRSKEARDEDDYDMLEVNPRTVLRGSRGGGLRAEPTLDLPPAVDVNKQFESILGTNSSRLSPDGATSSARDRPERRPSLSIKLKETGEKGRYILKSDDPELREILQKWLIGETNVKNAKKRTRFRDLVFTRQFTAFDRQNNEKSPFHGFYTLFWLATFLMLVRIAANNWRFHGSVFGTNEILSLMFHHDVMVLGLTDGVMAASTVFCLLLQKAISAGYLNWNREGWIIQHIWQTVYLAVAIGWTIHRDWPWSHTIFFVLHTLCMLMKQHSYSFYNGYLSETLRRKKALEMKLMQLKELDPETPSSYALATSYLDQKDVNSIHRRRSSVHSKNTAAVQRQDLDLANVAAAVKAGTPLDDDQIDSFRRIIKSEIEGLTEEVQGKCSPGSKNVYPHNLNIRDFAGYIPLPTLVYELEYPRQERINWFYVAEKTAATFGVLFVMNVVSQSYIYPQVVLCMNMKEQGVPLQQRLQELLWITSDLIFPLMMETLLVWYVIWECILNVLAELTLFADRGFYADWWNSTSWDQYARDWNRPVHAFLLRHVYHSSISALQISRSSATLITFLLSACVHELVMWCLFKKLRGYLLVFQMMQLPLISVSRRWMQGSDVLGNLLFWCGIFTGFVPSLNSIQKKRPKNEKKKSKLTPQIHVSRPSFIAALYLIL
ncbi:acyl-CoA/sterol acyltransferase [Pseudocyphellaria aurata]|nr:acyl-CoA/sterol acyltransferase [Pseudocyphellaria aurata]